MVGNSLVLGVPMSTGVDVFQFEQLPKIMKRFWVSAGDVTAAREVLFVHVAYSADIRIVLYKSVHHVHSAFVATDQADSDPFVRAQRAKGRCCGEAQCSGGFPNALRFNELLEVDMSAQSSDLPALSGANPDASFLARHRGSSMRFVESLGWRLSLFMPSRQMPLANRGEIGSPPASYSWIVL